MTAFVVGRNELARLPTFFAHYRGLGVTRFHYLDNGSTDGSAEYLKKQPDVEWVPIKETYGPDNAWGSQWQMTRIKEFSPYGWVLALYVDELLHLPLPVNLEEMTSLMDQEGANLMKVNLVDCYPRGSLHDASMTDCVWCDRPYFDTELKQLGISTCQRLGRLRHRVFQIPNAYYSKSPLFRWNDTVDACGFHHLSGRLRRSRYVGMIAHCKFVSTFKAYVDDSVVRRVHWNDSQEYRKYQEKFLNIIWHPDYSEQWSDNLHRFNLLSGLGSVSGEGGHVLGDHYYFGRDGIGRDETEAFRLWQEDAELGVIDAMNRMVIAYLEGVGCAPDPKKVDEWKRRIRNSST